ncbi:MAG: MBL fold metallo-hydrolase [Bdellovibrionales bacterium]|nr:MBL fold metallo-hydrolase [Bdellovibrionales bacterium]
MKVTKIIHAGLVVETGQTCVLMDPVLKNPIESGTVLLDPPIEIDLDRLRGFSYDAIILSHEHHDHFCIESLALLKRTAQVIYPKGCDLIRHSLERLGFKNTFVVEPGSRVQLGDLNLRFTYSRAPFPELGVVFQSGRDTCWNLVDTKLTPETIRSVKDEFGTIDLLLAEYQPLVEANLWRDALGGGFPYDLYQKVIRQVIEIAPRAVVPFSCNFISATQDWINSRLFPMTEERFLRDLKACLPELQTEILAPGWGLEISGEENLKLEENRLNFLRNISGRKTSAHVWDPERGVPILEDKNSFGLAIEELRIFARKFVEEEYVRRMNDASLQEFSAPFRKRLATWNLNVLYPDGTLDTYWMSFQEGSLGWGHPPADGYMDIRTTIVASAIWGIRKGHLSPFSLIFGGMMRRSYRLYQLSTEGILWPDSIHCDPFFPVLCSGSLERAAHLCLKRLGF